MPSLGELSRSDRRLLIRAMLRSTVIVALLVAAYCLLPLDHPVDTRIGAEFAIGLTLLVAATIYAIRQVLRSSAPRLRALQAMAVGVPLLVLVFASMHVIVSNGTPGSYSEVLSRLDGIYFTVTVFATVGFGDIVPVSEVARTVTTVQMVVGVIVVGLVVKLMFGAVQEAMRRRDRAGSGGSPDRGDADRPGPTHG